MANFAKYLYEIGQLKRVRRSGWWIAGIDHPESVAEHSFRTAILGYILAHLEGADPMETAVMCLFHDAQEARVNDLHKVAARYLGGKEAGEIEAFQDQVEKLSTDISEELISLMHTYESRNSLEAKVAHDADLLECLIQAREYQSQGYADVQNWINNCHAGLKTEAAKQIAEECLQVEPKEWWQGLM